MRKAVSAAEQSHRAIRIVAVVAGTSIALSCGTNYGFSAWAPQFAERLQLSATQTELMGSFGNIGMYAMGVPGGILIDSKGPRWGVLMGSIFLACGYFPLKSAYDKGPGATSVTALCFLALLTGMGSCTAFTAALKVCATNWPQHRGTATAFPLSAFGLSAFFYTTLASIIFPDNTSGYLFLLAVGTTAMTFGSIFFLSMVPPPMSEYQSVASSDDQSGLKRSDSNQMHRRTASNRPTSRDSTHINSTAAAAAAAAAAGNISEVSSLVGSDFSAPGDIQDDSATRHHLYPRPDLTGWAVLHAPKFWQLFILLSLLAGTGIMTINNIGNDARSLWHHFDPSASRDFLQQRQLLHVSILSFCSFLGRLASGIGSDWLIHHNASRFWTLVASACVFVVAQILALVLTNPHNLFLLSGLTGVAYGMLFGVFPALVADAFGSTGMGINWGCMTLAPVVSGAVFNLIYGSILDQRSTLHSRPDGKGNNAERACDAGKECYAGAYWITLCAASVGVAWSLYCIRQERAEIASEKHERAHEP